MYEELRSVWKRETAVLLVGRGGRGGDLFSRTIAAKPEDMTTV